MPILQGSNWWLEGFLCQNSYLATARTSDFEALQRGHQVTVVVRDPSRVTQRHERLKIEQGDALNSSDVARLVAKRM